MKPLLGLGAAKAADPDQRVRVRRAVPSAILTVIVLFGSALVLGFHPAQVSAAAVSYSIWPDTKTPAVTSDPDTERTVIGTKFRVSTTGVVTALKFYKSKDNTGVQSGVLWSSAGQQLGTVTFPGNAAPGWVKANLAHPVSLRSGATYVVSYVAPHGHYAGDQGVFSGAPLVSGPITALQGVYSYDQAFPTSVWRGSAYYVDVVFTPAGTPGPTSTSPPTPPSTTAPPKPTASPTNSGQSRRLNCAPTPSSCGYPDATNTGPASTTKFVRVPTDATSGPGWRWNATWSAVIVSGAGATLNGLNIAGQVLIDAPNVTVSNSRISACGGANDNDVVAVRYRSSDPSYRGSNARVVRNAIIGTPSGCSRRARSGIRDVYGAAPNLVAQGNNISGTGNGITAEYSATIVDNWIHDLGHVAGDHHSGISAHGGALQLTVRHNTVLLYGQKFPGGGGVSGALTVYADFGHAQNFTAQDNLISGGSYVVYGGNSGDAYRTPSTNVRFLDNRFVCGNWLYGPVAAFSLSAGNQWSGNYCDQTGTAVNR